MMIDLVWTSANRKSDPSAVNETKSAFFVERDNDRVVAPGHAGRFATIPRLAPAEWVVRWLIGREFSQRYYNRP
jgi:hypothetical protein